MRLQHAFSDDPAVEVREPRFWDWPFIWLGSFFSYCLSVHAFSNLSRNLSTNVKIGSGVKFGSDSNIVNFCGPESVQIGDLTVCRGILRNGDFGPSELIIGRGVYIGDGVIISCTKSIRIGDYTLIAHGVEIFDNDSHPVDPSQRERDWKIVLGEAQGARTGIASEAILVGSRVWIGAGARILKGVTIGDGAIVGAGSVVSVDVPAMTVVAGNPAKAIRILSPKP